MTVAIGTAILAMTTGWATVAPAQAEAQARADAGPDAGHRAVAVRVATYNIAAGAGAGGFDLDATAATLRALDADIIGLEEVDVHWSARSQWRDLATELADQLDMRVFFGPIYSLEPPSAGAPRREFGVAILSRYPILRATNHDITRLSTQVPNPVPEPAPGFPEVLVNANGALIRVYVTHLDYRGDPTVRTMQVADMLRIMAEDDPRPTSQVLVGDFNAPPGASELAPLWEELDDAWAVANGPDGGLTYPANEPVRRIDYIATSRDVRVQSADVVESLASDHRPVVAELLVPRGRRR
jgi:endonuclease/exonuclease/phosphatase family metal-dependent hydrolase